MGVDLDPVAARPGKRLPLKRRGKVVRGIGCVGNQRDFGCRAGIILKIQRVRAAEIFFEVVVPVTVPILCRISKIVRVQAVLILPVIGNAVAVNIQFISAVDKNIIQRVVGGKYIWIERDADKSECRICGVGHINSEGLFDIVHPDFPCTVC